MQNITMTVTKSNYGSKGATQATGTGYFANYKVEGTDHEYRAGGGYRKTLFDVLDESLHHVLNGLGYSGNTAAVTINLPEGVTLSVALQDHIIDKFTLEDEFTSITFA